MMPDINITFVNYFSKENLLQALESVMADIAACPFSIALTVVDNSHNSDGLGQELQKRFPAVAYIDAKENIGFGRANTRGFLHTEARYYFALNPDTLLLPESKTIQRIIEFMDAHPKVGAIGPKLVYMDGSKQASCYRFDRASILAKPFKHIHFDKRFRLVQKHIDTLLMRDFDQHETRPVDWVLGAALVVRQKAADQVGYFDERYHMYFEDCDWCRALWEHGWPVYFVHDIVIQHRYMRESARIPGIIRPLLQNQLTRTHAISWIKYLWKWRHTHRFYRSLK